ncbi:D-2-hydroxyacid dehydrogenase [Lactiplantibacillus plantarum]|uniref:D-2-hydroxyacid dehydrogenase n=1 Tax=Lactiplantibacillus plantarum TaxID=1590 RepID=UPI001AF1877A|nr:D-2-hydroxyacid dehydrogenase [Lactiplantibacillus plantarum]MBY7658812.1 D-2-hydroxyacid dehydrogenase [Lactiplantibacillus plantarum]QSE53966.1 D-2-hydroxyacid dehydrogenase [Lactiplantibacillus plantarum]
MKIVLLDGYELNKDLNWKSLQELGDCTLYDRTPVNDNAEIIKRIKYADIVITHKTPLDHEVISKTSRLKYIGIMGTGYDVVDIESAHQNKVVVTNIPTYASDAVAQFTFSLLLEVTSQVGLHNQLVHENRWAQAPDFTFWEKPLLELKGKTLGLIGYGHIAQKVAKIGHAFSMKVIFYNHRPKKVSESWIQQVSFDELLRQSDVLSLHVIQTPETIDLINNDTIAKMKTGVIILNTARGKLANEADIKNALNEGKIYAYATDVVKGEPIASDSPLLQAKNCYITPHIAWAPYETRERLLHMTVDNIKAYLSGDLKNVIN